MILGECLDIKYLEFREIRHESIAREIPALSLQRERVPAYQSNLL